MKDAGVARVGGGAEKWWAGERREGEGVRVRPESPLTGTGVQGEARQK